MKKFGLRIEDIFSAVILIALIQAVDWPMIVELIISTAWMMITFLAFPIEKSE